VPHHSKKLPAPPGVGSAGVPVADRGGEEVNVGFSDFGAGSGNQLWDPRAIIAEERVTITLHGRITQHFRVIKLRDSLVLKLQASQSFFGVSKSGPGKSANVL
jgi:hypothetical protein